MDGGEKEAEAGSGSTWYQCNYCQILLPNILLTSRPRPNHHCHDLDDTFHCDNTAVESGASSCNNRLWKGNNENSMGTRLSTKAENGTHTPTPSWTKVELPEARIFLTDCYKKRLSIQKDSSSANLEAPVTVNRTRRPPFANDEKFLKQIELNIIPNHHFPYVKLESMGSNEAENPRFKKRISCQRSQFFKAARRRSNKAKNMLKMRKYISTNIKSHGKSSKYPNLKLSCHICSEEFSYQFALTRHLFKHEGEVDKPYLCSMCNQSYETSNLLKLHLIEHHSYSYKSAIKRKSCSSRAKRSNWKQNSTNSLIELKQFMANNTDITLLVAPRKLCCPHCPKKFPYVSALNKHIISHTKPHCCQKCGSSYRDLFSLALHEEKNICELLLDQKNRRTFQCEHCDKIYTRRESLGRHMRSIHGIYVSQNVQSYKEIKKYICIFCGYDAPSPYALEAHNRSHTGEKPFSCNACGKSFSKKQNLNSHIQFFCEEAKRLGLVPVPETSTKTRPSNTILKRNPSKQLYKCSKCDQTFPSNPQKTKHERSHGDKHPCPFCPAKFAHYIGLGIHKNRIHKDKLEDYCCVICDLKFSTRSAYEVHKFSLHKKKHLKSRSVIDDSNSNLEDKYTCRFCPYQSSNLSNLKRHNRSHTGEKPFKCNRCGKSFSQKPHLNRHQLSCQSNNRYNTEKEEIIFSIEDEEEISLNARFLCESSLQPSSSLKFTSTSEVDNIESVEFSQNIIQESNIEGLECSSMPVRLDPIASFDGDGSWNLFSEDEMQQTIDHIKTTDECDPGLSDHNDESLFISNPTIIPFDCPVSVSSNSSPLDNEETLFDPSTVSVGIKIETFESFY